MIMQQTPRPANIRFICSLLVRNSQTERMMCSLFSMSARQSAKRNWNMKQVRRSLKQEIAARSHRNWSGLSVKGENFSLIQKKPCVLPKELRKQEMALRSGHKEGSYK
jgi:hypothetical protein